MKHVTVKQKRYDQRKRRVRAKISGTEARPRLSVYRSLKHIYAQIIDDEKGVTLVAASDLSAKGKNLPAGRQGKKSDAAALVGEDLAKKALTKKIKKVAFDKGASRFHGRVKALAEGARKGGLDF
ncbi:MAG: 50S ribosomal protein L18 [bacterium]|nr:50S ribosomal protein L18 [bacterium]